MSDESLQPSRREQLRKRKNQMIVVGACVVAVLMVVAAVVGREMYRTHRRNKAIAAAAAAVPAPDPKASPEVRAVQSALRANPSDLASNRKMADIAEAANSNAAIQWRKRVVQLQANIPENYLALVNTAVKFGDLASAKAALAGVKEDARGTVAYHEAAMKVALLSRDGKVAEAELAEAVRLDPEKAANQLNLAVLHLSSPDKTQRTEARKALEGFVAKPESQRSASRALLNECLQEKDFANALKFGKLLRTAPDSTLQDALTYLGVLKKLERREFWWCLGQLQSGAAAKADQVAVVMGWMNRNGLAQQSIDWVTALPAVIQAKMPVPPQAAEAYATLNQWDEVKPLVENANWAAAEYRRIAFLARALRQEGDEANFVTQWIMALDTTGTNTRSQIELAKLANDWKWEDEYIEVLWKIAGDAPDPRPALTVLNQKYAAKGDTKKLREVAARALELTPKDVATRNNLAYYNLLLKDDVERGVALATEVYKEAPANPAIIATYSFALHVQGKDAEARKLMAGQGDAVLSRPGQALCYGLVLAGAGAKDEALKYFDIARGGSLLPEEKAMIDGK